MKPPHHSIQYHLRKAAAEGNLKGLKAALENGQHSIRNTSCALKFAATNGHADCVRELIPVSDTKDHGNMALMWATLNGHIECVKLLAPLANHDFADSQALRLAASSGHVECIKELIPYSDVKKAIRILIQNNQQDAAELLQDISMGKEPRKPVEAKKGFITVGTLP